MTDQATGKPVADASVTWQAGATEFGAETNADGSCALDLPACEVAGAACPAGSVEMAGYTTATVHLDAKGWQSRVCSNTLALSGDAGKVTLRGGEPPADAYWGGGKQVPFAFPVAQVGMQRAELRVTAGTCSGSTDLDDFGIKRVRAYFS